MCIRLSLVVVAVAAVLGVVAVPAAAAAEPGIIRFEFSGTFTDPDFCGTGQTVNGAFAEHYTLFHRPEPAWCRRVANA
jgi:hypothetical protein